MVRYIGARTDMQLEQFAEFMYKIQYVDIKSKIQQPLGFRAAVYRLRQLYTSPAGNY